MEKLRKAGLFGGDMVLVSGSLAERYNACLAKIGQKPTRLKTFSVDGMGWSPEIAVEKKNNFYLNNGPANVNAIILSPEQEGKATHMPSHSFDRDVINTVFRAYRSEIRDITKDSAFIVHLDQDLDAFHEVYDLLYYKKIEVQFDLLDDLDLRQKEQQKLIDKFMDKHRFIDRKLHNELLQHAKTYGDLRKRKLSLDPIALEINSFYTRAFGGVFVLKEFLKPMLIFEDEKEFKKASGDTLHQVEIYHCGHDELLPALVDDLILEAKFKESIRSPRYQRIRNHLFAENVPKTEHALEEILESHFLFKKYLNDLDASMRQKIMSPERYLQKSIVDKNLEIREFVDKDYIKALHQPHSSLATEQQKLIWKLLSKIMPLDPVHLYWYDKDQFYSTFGNWDPGYQNWVISTILELNEKYVTETH